ncbi:YceK/YidQ family lipoprotein [Pseudomonas sp. GD04087]|uniref:YceK/YidQ family lipoprotein n=2 Tax=Pseudomonas TaxID=286 RepID=UPI00244AA795|nr:MULTISPECIES: YceK/YidQ family lipoprotein [unclassified Pseudomonas]MDH0292667.1 YceK/YidQ family lipoprotein [Pseudomonas sp. GD04087]MDH1048019.1 YceK/YidQ family lipoprotein [Pseudomonas sp. GD03903]
MTMCRSWLLFSAALLSGCGSYHTLHSDDVVSASELNLKGTYCGAIPRVYGGVVWDACQLYGEPPADTGYTPPSAPANHTFGPQILPLLDMAFSGVVDTFALPYTLYRQNRDGSIQLTHD